MSDPLIIDIAHWSVSDKAFQEERKAKWSIVEDILIVNCHKKKKALNIIKKYYLKGELPNWEALSDATDSGDIIERHLDITTFLWLHPSNNYDVLLELTNAYYTGYGRLPQDIQTGIHFLFNWGVFISSYNGGGYSRWRAKTPCFDGKGRLIFNLIYSKIIGATYNMEVKGIFRTETTHKILEPGLGYFKIASKWLCLEKLNEYGAAMIFQYEEVIATLFNMINSDPIRLGIQLRNNYDQLAESFYRIANFDTEKEGNTPRTHYVNLVRKTLDEDDHLPEIKNLWARIKNNEITVKNPWKL